MPRANERADHGADFGGLLLGQVAEVLDLQCAIGILVGS
jgi:hypothetical protein